MIDLPAWVEQPQQNQSEDQLTIVWDEDVVILYSPVVSEPLQRRLQSVHHLVEQVLE